jgi:hypothetical protein
MDLRKYEKGSKYETKNSFELNLNEIKSNDNSNVVGSMRNFDFTKSTY